VRRLRPALLAALAIAALAGPAAGSPTPESEAQAVAQAREWKGRWCPLDGPEGHAATGCGAPPPASFASFGGFAAAALGALALARRRSS